MESSENFPREGKLLGVDFGTKRVGLAVSTPDQVIASPLEVYQRRNESQDAKHYLEVVKEYRISALVMGLPIHLSGADSQSARRAREYGDWLVKLTGLPILYWDERFTSAVAEDQMIGIDMTRKQRKRRMDMVAAQIMLQAYLDYCAKQDEADAADSDEI